MGRRLILTLLFVFALISVFAGCGRKTPGGSGDHGEDPGPITRPLDYFEDFSDPASGWPNETGYSREVGYEDGEYLFKLDYSEEKTLYVSTEHWLVDEYEVSVRATYKRGLGIDPTNDDHPIYGLQFNWDGIYIAGDHKLYAFGIYPEIQWFLIAVQKDYFDWSELYKIVSEKSEHIKPAIDEWNELRVKVDRGQAWFYINGHLVHGPEKIKMHPGGERVGLFASNDRNMWVYKWTDVRFDDFHLTGTELVKPNPY